MTDFIALNNPNLNCIQVDDAAWSTSNWSNIDAGASFSTNCNLSINRMTGKLSSLNAYPNPTTGKISLVLGKRYANTNVEVSNIIGQVIFSNNYKGEQNLDLILEGGTGVYFIKVKTEEGEALIKVVKE